MRSLGYYDGYLGFLSAPGLAGGTAVDVVDMGSGTASFAEAWIAVNGVPRSLTLVDPSRAMLDRGRAALSRRGVAPETVAAKLGETPRLSANELLVAHVIEHCPDPARAVADLAAMLRPGGRLRLVVSKPHWCNVIIWLQWRHRTFTEAEITRLITDAGLIVETTYAFPAGPPSRTSRGLVARKPE
ncbi:methyltransferase domain-containing protein [Alphaproteobacteria bacterium GH1-50]|uniref:Methyltransferase domain-containing protein n=2 Tax=Kangsaoukella pontilimi TaxID=2691042 RepID=A0A7C9IHA5_9RHOB|nr:methyltransferase domain-containing protein [Kangsaoukella pontilimi]